MMTVGELKAALVGVPDDMPVAIGFEGICPNAVKAEVLGVGKPPRIQLSKKFVIESDY